MTHMVVTGAAGFIGSHVVDRLLGDGHRVIGIDCFTDYYARDLKEANLAKARSHPHFTLVERDLLGLLQPGNEDALGLDHFEGRSFRGWHHHVTLVSVAHGFLTVQRLDPKADAPA